MSDDLDMMTFDEALDLVDTMVSVRYPGYTGMDFLAAFSEGTAEERFPGCEDLLELAEVLEA